MRTHSLGREELGESPLYVNTLHRIGIVAAPELRKIFQSFVIASGTSTRTKHHRHIRIFLLDTLEYIVDTSYMVDIHASLAILEIRRIDIGYRAVAVPLEICNIRILSHNIVNNTENMVLNLRIAHVKNKLIAIIVDLTVLVMYGPVRMLLKQFTFRINHLRFDPYSELHSCLFCSINKSRYASREFVGCSFPVAQSGLIILTRIFVGKPTVVKKEHIDTKMLGLVHKVAQNLLVKVKSSVFPIVEQGQSLAFSVLQTVSTCPIMKIAASLRSSVETERKNKLWSHENFVFRQFVSRSVRIDGRKHTQIAYIVNFKSKTEIAGPSQCTHQHITLIFTYRLVESNLEKRMHMHCGTAAELCIKNFLSKLKTLAAHTCFACPIAAELSEVIRRATEIKHGRSVCRKSYRIFLLMTNFAPSLDYIFFWICYIMKYDIDRVFVIAKIDDCMSSTVDCRRRGRYIVEICRRFAVVMRNSQSRFKKIFISRTAVYFPSATAHTAV